MPGHEDSELVTVNDVAELAGVGASAVSNWRRRHDDFPDAVGHDAGSDLFRRHAVIEWLGSHPSLGRREHRPARSGPFSDTDFRLTTALLALRAIARERIDEAAEESRSDASLGQAIVEIATQTKSRHPDLHEVFADLRDADAADVGEAARQLLATEQADRRSLSDLFEELLRTRDRARAESPDAFRTAPSLAELVVHLADVSAGDVVFDPAAGEGGFLLTAAEVVEETLVDERPRLIGYEKNEETWRIAKQRFLVHGLDVDLRLGDSLLGPPAEDIRADAVVCDPPYGLRVSAEAWSPMDPRWRFGMPPKLADLAWIELALYHLRASGRACVVLPAGSLFRRGLEARTRVELLRNQAVEAIVALPAGTATSSTVAVALWLLRPPGSIERDSVLFIDAAQRRPVSRERQDAVAGIRGGLGAGLRSRIVDTVRAWRDHPESFKPIPEFAAAVPLQTLLQSEGDLVPTRWTRLPSLLDPETTIDRIRRQQARVQQARERIAALPPVELNLSPRRELPPRKRISELAAEGAVQIIAGVRIEATTSDEAGRQPVAGVWDLRGEAPRYAETRVRSGPVTEPGDVIVAPAAGGLRAQVDRHGGRIIAAPLQVIRVRSNSLDPDLVAAFVSNPDNVRLATGSVSPRISVREIELPLLDPVTTAALRNSLALFAEEERAGRDLARDVHRLRDALVAAISQGLVGSE